MIGHEKATKDQFEAFKAGLGILESWHFSGVAPAELAHGWEEVADPGYYNPDQAKHFHAYTHPDPQVRRAVMSAKDDLFGSGTTPGLNTKYMYINDANL